MFGIEEEQKLKNIPPKYEYLRPLLDNIGPGRICLFIRKHYAIHGVSVLSEAPIITALYLYNRKITDFERIESYTNKYYGKHASTRILGFVMEQDMGLDLARKYWENRNTTTTAEFFETLQLADEKYIDYILSTDKFYRAMKIDIESNKITKDLGDPRILEVGKKYKRFNNLCVEIFNRYDDDKFIPPDARNIFVF